MAQTIQPSADYKYILIKVTEEINRELAFQFILEAHALGRQLEINRYLMDLTEAVSTDSFMDQYKLVNQDIRGTDGIEPLARVAIVVSPDDHTHDFIEAMTRKLGLDVTIFRDLSQAVSHLEKE